MFEHFYADLEQLRDRAPEYDRIADAVSKTVRELEATLNGAQAPWGHDDAGKSFSRTYVPEQQQALSDLNSLAQVLHQSGQDLKRLGDNMATTDDAGRRHIENTVQLSPWISASPRLHSNLPDRRAEASPQTTTPVKASPSVRSSLSCVPPVDGAIVDTAAVPDIAGVPAVAPITGQTVSDGAPAQTPHDEKTSADSSPAIGQHQGWSAGKSPGAGHPGGTSGGTHGSTSTRPAAANLPASTPPTTSGMPPVAPSAISRPSRNPWSPQQSFSSPWSARPAADGPANLPPRIAAHTSNTSDIAPPQRPTPPSRSQPPAAKLHAPRRPKWKPVAPGVGSTPTRSQATRLAQEIAERHRLQVFGFDTAGVPDGTLVEIAAALDNVLPRHWPIDLRGIGIGELPDGTTTRMEWDIEPATAYETPPGTTRPPTHLFTARIMLASHAAADPGRLAKAITATEGPGGLATKSAQRPVYSSIVRQLGAALDVAGGFRARRSAHRALILEYLPLRPLSELSLQATVAGFRRWRAQLPSSSFQGSRLDPAAALSASFAEVVLSGTHATPAAKALHRLLVHTAEMNTPTVGAPPRSSEG